MANSSTALNDVPAGYYEADSITEVRRVIIDTVDTDLTVFTPASGLRWGISGLQYASSNAHNLLLKSDTQELVTYQLAANSGIFHPVGSGFMLFSDDPDEALIIQSSAAIDTMLFYIQEFTTLPLGDDIPQA